MSRQALRRASYRTATDYVIEAGRILLDKPYLRKYIYERAVPPAADSDPATMVAPVPKGSDMNAGGGGTTTSYAEVMALAEFYLDVLEAVWDYRPEFTPSDRVSWREWIHDLFQNSPALQHLYEENDDWYPTLKALLDWEPCNDESHTWAAVKRGPMGTGVAFHVRRLVRRTPAIGHLIKR